jgi:hypothetical protein
MEWKKSVENILNNLRKNTNQRLVLTDRTIEITNSEETSIEKWETIQHATINPESIFLRGSFQTGYLFPAKSMEPLQFEELTVYIKEIMRAVSTTAKIDMIEK